MRFTGSEQSLASCTLSQQQSVSRIVRPMNSIHQSLRIILAEVPTHRTIRSILNDPLILLRLDDLRK
jgi:hypothetical protein